MGLSSLGIGSNLDIEGMVTKLMSVEQAPLTRMAKTETSYQAKLTGFGTLKGAIAQFQSSVRALSDVSKFQAVKSSVIDSSVATVSATATAATGTYALQVTQLAHNQKLVADGVASDSMPLGKGVITFDFGTIVGPLDPATGKNTGATLDPATGKYTDATAFTAGAAASKTVTIDGASSLADIRDAINKAAIGVTAAIVNDGSGTPYRLTLTQQSTGEASSMKISVADADPAASPLLSAVLTNDPLDPAHAMKETATATNAKFSVDGIAVSKATNTITDVLSGVTINLMKENPGTTTALTVARDTASVSNAVTSFVKAYNDISQTLRDAMAYNATTKTGAILNGEASVRTIQTQVRNVMSAPISGAPGGFSTLSQIGVSMQKDGTLAIDSTKLNTALTTNFDGFAGLFATTTPASTDPAVTPASVNGYAAQFDQLATTLLGTDGPLTARTNGITASIKNLNLQETAISDRLAGIEKRYRAQFTALDLSISSMNTTSSYLTQQLTAISNLSKQ
ncbi:MAG TPA: flagellar filament capping protein FliD [Telluria sp.]|nr:flagellar filament capping protein FliD [Telluria sp.]